MLRRDQDIPDPIASTSRERNDTEENEQVLGVHLDVENHSEEEDNNNNDDVLRTKKYRRTYKYSSKWDEVSKK